MFLRPRDAPGISPGMNSTTPLASPARVALVTGSSRGIGRSAALALADRGVDVILTYLAAEKEAAEVGHTLRAKGRKAIALRLDVGNVASFDAFAEDVRRRLGQEWQKDTFDYLVNNAGSGGFAPFAETTEATFDALVGVHFKGPFFLTQKLLPLLADGGRIVNVSTGLTRYTYPGVSVYSAAKSAVESLTRSLAFELGPRRIAVNTVAPGGIATDFAGGFLRDPKLQESVSADTALGRIGQPEDVAEVIAWLLSSETNWVNGQRIEVAGGFRL